MARLAPYCIIWIIAGLFLAGCGGSGSSSTASNTPIPATPLTGYFIDAPVAGVNYRTATVSGVTGTDGSFDYASGEIVELSVGPVALGQVTATTYVTPLDLIPNAAGYSDPRVIAMASFLQSSDQDADLSNGIQVFAALADRLCAVLNVATLDIATLDDTAAFQAALQTASIAEGLSYVTPTAASAHLSVSLMALMEQTAVFNPSWSTAGVFTGAERCSQCHQARSGEIPMRLPAGDVDGEDISPSTEWKHSVMAHSFDDPYFQAVLQEESTHEFPAFTGFIEDRCLTCHTPMGRTHALKTNTGLDADGYYRYDQAVADQHGREGVSCTLCHQVAASALDNAGNPVVGEDSFSGNFQIGDARIIYGPFAGVNTNPMQNQVNYTPQYGYHVTASGYCASCHTVRTPVMDANTGTPAVPAREFVEQAPYQEWENSIFSRSADANERRSCQDCHMPVPENYQTAITTRPLGQPERSPYNRHSLFGGNTHVLDMLKTFRTVLGIESSTSVTGFDEKIAATREFLEQDSATLDITRLAVVAGTLELDVTVTNLSGHKLPTAYPSRRAWLQVRLTDGNGATVFESGAPGADGRLSIDTAATQPECLAISKPSGFANGSCFEPHRDVITDSAQVAVYESVLADTNGHINHVLLYADHYLKDNRIPPRGFRQADAIAGTAIVLGGVADADFDSEDADGGSGADQVHYRIPVGASTGPYQVQARLLYQSIRPSFVKGLHGDRGRVERFRLMYKMLPPPVEELASVSQTLN